MATERGKWEQMARDLAAVTRKRELLRGELERVEAEHRRLTNQLWMELENEERGEGA